MARSRPQESRVWHIAALTICLQACGTKGVGRALGEHVVSVWLYECVEATETKYSDKQLVFEVVTIEQSIGAVAVLRRIW